MAKKEIVSYKGKDYTLEFTRTTVSQIEKRGFSLDDLTKAGGTMGLLLVVGAFQANHPSLSEDKRIEIYKAWKPEKGENGEKRTRISILADMYVDSIKWLFDDDESEENPTE